MKKIFYYFSCLIVLSSSLLHSMSVELDPNEFFATHVTPHFPKNGVMIPGVTRPDTGKLPESPIPNPRITLHWYPFGAHEAHGKNNNSGVKYLIIERGKEVYSRFSGGEAEDLYMVGPHLLSKNSLILVPQEEEAFLRAQNPGFLGEFISYDSKKGVEAEGIRTIKERKFNPRNIYLSKEQILQGPLNLQQIAQARQIITQNPDEGCLVQRQGRTYISRVAAPEEQEMNVNEKNINAKRFFNFPSDFVWGAHQESIYTQFENITVAVFAPVFYKAGFMKKEYYDSVITQFLVPTAIANTQKMLLPLLKEVMTSSFRGSYVQDQQLFKAFMNDFSANMKTWLQLSSLQISKMTSVHDVNSFKQTPYGNDQILQNEVDKLVLKSFNPADILGITTNPKEE